MTDKLYIYIINNQNKAAIVPRPVQFGYPPHIKIGDKMYFNSNRMRYSNESPTGEAMIYTEKVHKFDLSLLEGNKPETADEPTQEETVEAKPKRTAEDILLDRILYIGDELPKALLKDKRPKFVVLGTPQEFLDEVQNG